MKLSFLTYSLITIVNTFIGPAPADYFRVYIFYRCSLQMGQISRVVVPGKPFQPNMFVCKVGAYPSEARFFDPLITIVNTFIGPAPVDCPVIFYRPYLQMA